MSGINGDDDKVAFSLADTNKKKKKKKKRKTPVSAPDFGDLEESQEKAELLQARTSPLVIPLIDAGDSDGPRGRLLLAARAKEAVASSKDPDAAAAQALVQSAAQHFAEKQQQQSRQDGDTNFSADGKLIIASSNNNEHVPKKQPPNRNDDEKDDAEAQQLRRDLENRPDEPPVDSDVYQATPISEFGAAMLRGMGWKGEDSSGDRISKSSSNLLRDSGMMPRPHRLGLGATPKLPPVSSSSSVPGKMRRPDQVRRDERLARQRQEYEEQHQKRVRQDKQQTLQVGSIVSVGSNHHGRQRARIVKLAGVPGLNRVLVQLEGEAESTSIKRGDVGELISRDELEHRPFREAPEKQREKEKTMDDDKGKRHRDDNDDQHVGRESKRSREDRRRDERDSRGKDRRHRDYDQKRTRREERDRRQEGHRELKERHRDEDPEHWLFPNIRVRVVTRRLGRHQYKQKGVVLDVTHGGANATLQLADGQVIDRVPERDLETALPKIGGHAIVLIGKHKYSKGRLLERNSDLGKGVVQVFEDMSVLTLSLDDLAEWCGPLDDDMME